MDTTDRTLQLNVHKYHRTPESRVLLLLAYWYDYLD